MSDGNGKNWRVSIDIVDDGEGWAFFGPGKEKPPLEILPGFLSDGLMQWMKAHPTLMIRNTLGIVADGATVGVHVWYDEA